MGEQVVVTPALLDYVREVSQPEPAVLAELRAETALLPGGGVLPVPPGEGAFLALLVALTGARLVVEVGTFTGYSTLCLASALPDGGRVITCELSPKWPAIARPHWERAGVADRIEVLVGDAADSLAGLTGELAGRVDLVFVDADKAGYPRYYELAVELVRPGGLVVVDNTLFSGRVADPAAVDPDTEGVRELNRRIAADDRVQAVLLAHADGMTLARRTR
ncbi:class I SAM-dependent methyltransferase [Actinosynnema pretiosum subsp. pretiosum]|uniref:Caffeoyl-CoA O-methyltransferase n=2 Tax=Actinosynnema TaxID=40566 RepID=C6W8K1_ACTMD|nr:class I SAM-dependent methyltransferase [Actinosynnema mirum]ACU37100.1 Caffeoyl-CoA O-methyltransferase [Actinosynnema mirum DSM 43827]AQZ37104.1 O-methyltransferase [Actinosynnema pretiosum subsp. pretiosum]AXX30583.1 O-methyltransferase, family 3 [Actinosynnema pretiosum subsp. pretiosum]QUF05282.1 class I SAM-dependent methyltransferase [Actinosynnema pretiosum subsp. pretiosum]